MSIKPLQDYLFQQVKEKLPKNVQLVDAVADLLHLSNDSAYRRIRGETPLVLDELQLILQHLWHFARSPAANKKQYGVFQRYAR